jgi:hypothetical protein
VAWGGGGCVLGATVLVAGDGQSDCCGGSPRPLAQSRQICWPVLLALHDWLSDGKPYWLGNLIET